VKAEYHRDEDGHREQRAAHKAELGLLLRSHREEEIGIGSQFTRLKNQGKIEAQGAAPLSL
jgi:hypothetical protein